MKALSKRQSDRYSTAWDLADDLRHFLQTLGDGSRDSTMLEKPLGRCALPDHDVKVVPKGLRSFDENDAEFFLQLLPGPTDRDGLPASIRFWKTRIESTDVNQAFRIGLIYGPSGCGKSSLLKAGLLPNLPPHILPVYLECSAEGNEARLLQSLYASCQILTAQQSLVDVMASLRRFGGPGNRKVLIVLDQFEQWLHAPPANVESTLIAALRHCDGINLQCLVAVRVDFWLTVRRFFDRLDVELSEGRNAELVDLFDPQHARRVLIELGRAYERLPAAGKELSIEQNEFLSEVVSELTNRNDRINCAHLALFTEMVKARPWTRQTLHQLGGLKGIGIRFLDETFGESTARPSFRKLSTSAQQVLWRCCLRTP